MTLTEKVEAAVRRELSGPLGKRETVEDERVLQAVREAATEDGGEFGGDGISGDDAALGARLALRLLCRLGRKYVGEARLHD